MPLTFSRRPLIAAALCAALPGASILLSGCASTPVASAVPASEAPQKKKKPEPVLMPMPTIDAFKGAGLFYFDDNIRTQLFIKDNIAVNGRYAVQENFPLGSRHGFTWGGGAAAILRNGSPLDAQRPLFLTQGNKGRVVIQFEGGGRKPLALQVKLVAYSLEGLPIGPYLVTRQNTATPSGYVIANRYVFPKGAVGYRAMLMIDNDEVLVPTKTAFTGSDSIENFSKRFTRDIPYCLRYIPTRRSEPVGMRFAKPITKQTKRVKGKLQEVAQSGEAQLMSVKKGTLFCQQEGKSQLSNARWDLRYINGTRVLSFTFPEEVRSADFGILNQHRDALRLAFAEEISTERRKTVKKVRPGVVWLGGKEILDAQWRFNEVAADAISDAIARTKDLRKDWEARNGKKK